MEFDELSNRVMGGANEVPRHLGPGLVESAYLRCLAQELSDANIAFETEKALPITYKGNNLDCGYRIDVLVDGRLVVELKAVDKLLPIHGAQVLTYLRMANVKTGLLINFNSRVLSSGIQRFVL